MTRGLRARHGVLSVWLVLTGVTIGGMLGWSMWLRFQDAFQAARDWLGWAILVMLLSMYVSDVIRGVRRTPGELADLSERLERIERALELQRELFRPPPVVPLRKPDDF